MDKLFKDTTRWLAAMHGLDKPTREQKGALTGAFRVLLETTRPGDDDLSRKRFAVVAVAIATAPQDAAPWGSDLMRAYTIGRHFEVHCLLNQHDHGDRLRELYGNDIVEISPAKARQLAVHWREIRGEWPWPHFDPREMASKESGLLYVEALLMDRLEELREANGGVALMLTSAYRTPERNAATPGAAKGSKHMLGQAVDLRVSHLDPQRLIRCAGECGFPGIAEYANASVPRVHLDVRPQGSWIAAPMGAFEPDRDYINADEERVTEPPADKTLGGAVAAGGTAVGAIVYDTIDSVEGGIIAAVTNISDTIARLASAVGQEMLPIAGAVVTLYTAYQYRRQLWMRLKGLLWSARS